MYARTSAWFGRVQWLHIFCPRGVWDARAWQPEVLDSFTSASLNEMLTFGMLVILSSSITGVVFGR